MILGGKKPPAAEAKEISPDDKTALKIEEE